MHPIMCHGSKLCSLQAQKHEFWTISINPLNAELNPICHLLALLGAHHILHIRRIRVKGDASKPSASSISVNLHLQRYAKHQLKPFYLHLSCMTSLAWAALSHHQRRLVGVVSVWKAEACHTACGAVPKPTNT